MAAFFDATSNPTTAGTSNLSWTHVLGSLGSNGLIIVVVETENNASNNITGATFNGVAMTEIIADGTGAGNGSSGRMYELHGANVPAAGSYTVTASFSAFDGSNNSRAAGCMSFGGITSQAAEASASINAGSGNLSKAITTITDNALIVVGYGNQNSNPPTYTTGETSEFNAIPASGELSIANGAYVVAGTAGSRTTSLTVTNPESEWMLLAAFRADAPSPSASASASGSASASKSLSPSASKSPSASASASASRSASASASSSVSASLSPSSSGSASPSPGFEDYTREHNASLPSNNNDLSTAYTDQEKTDVSSYNGVYVEQNGTLMYLLHQFKVFVGDVVDDPVVLFKGKSTIAPSLSPVYMQIYNQTTGWETIDSNNLASANTDFTLEKAINDFTAYKDHDQVISVRVWQLAL